VASLIHFRQEVIHMARLRREADSRGQLRNPSQA
jgi:hypothetical protein